MLSQQELSDRFEIQDLVFHYADLIDSKQVAREQVLAAIKALDAATKAKPVIKQRV